MRGSSSFCFTQYEAFLHFQISVYKTIDLLLLKIDLHQCLIVMIVYLRVVSATFFLFCFVCLKESTCETRKMFFFISLQ